MSCCFIDGRYAARQIQWISGLPQLDGQVALVCTMNSAALAPAPRIQLAESRRTPLHKRERQRSIVIISGGDDL